MRIFPYGSPILAQRAEKVLEFDDNLAKLAKNMTEEIDRISAVGLAAPQIGESVSLFVWHWMDSEGVAVNPRLTRSGPKKISRESCLSSPSVSIEVSRYSRVSMLAQDLEGHQYSLSSDTYLAIVWQHEYDHLWGRCVADQLNRQQRRDLAAQGKH